MITQMKLMLDRYRPKNFSCHVNDQAACNDLHIRVIAFFVKQYLSILISFKSYIKLQLSVSLGFLCFSRTIYAAPGLKYFRLSLLFGIFCNVSNFNLSCLPPINPLILL